MGERVGCRLEVERSTAGGSVEPGRRGREGWQVGGEIWGGGGGGGGGG